MKTSSPRLCFAARVFAFLICPALFITGRLASKEAVAVEPKLSAVSPESAPPQSVKGSLPENYLFNRGLIASYTIYECKVEGDAVEKELSFHVPLSASRADRKGDVFPVYRVPEGRMVWLSDWSFNVSTISRDIEEKTRSGGSLGRITPNGDYVYVLNCSVFAGEMKIFSPARSIRYLPGEWISVCFHHHGLPIDLLCRATFRFTEVPASATPLLTRFGGWAPSKQGPGLDQWLEGDFNHRIFRGSGETNPHPASDAESRIQKRNSNAER